MSGEVAPTAEARGSAIGRPLSRSETLAWLIALLACTSFVSFYELGGGADFEPTDAWVAQTAREMYERGDWKSYVVPRFSGEVRMQKSPGPYWAVCLTAWLRGTPIDEVATRIPNAVACLLLVATVFWLTRHIAGDRAAVFAGFATASSVLVLYWSHRGASDLGVTALMAFSLASLWIGLERSRGRSAIALILVGYFAAGLAMLYKQPMPLLGIGVPAILYVLLCGARSDAMDSGSTESGGRAGWFRSRLRLFASRWHLAGLLLFLLPWAPWAIALAVLQSGAGSSAGMTTDFWTTLHKWRVEYWDRFTGDLPNVEGQQQDVRMYFLYLGVAFVFSVPWCLSIPQAIAGGFQRREGIDRRGQWFLLVWLFGIFAALTVAAGKETRYFLPAMPPLLCLLGIELARFFNPDRAVHGRIERVGLLLAIVLVPACWIAGGVILRRVIRLSGEYAVYTWDQVAGPYVATAAIFTAGAIAAAWLYARRREHASFGVLVATMFGTFLYAWPTLIPLLTSEAPFRDFAVQLRDRLGPEHRSALRQVAQQDSRVIWYSDVRFPRVIDQLELLRRQGGRRDRPTETRMVAEEMVQRLRGEELALFVIEPLVYAAFQIGVHQELAERGEPLPPMHTWLIGRVGRPDHRYVVFGNRPPPWDEPTFALPARMIEGVLKQMNFAPSEVSRRLTLPKPGEPAGRDARAASTATPPGGATAAPAPHGED